MASMLRTGKYLLNLTGFSRLNAIKHSRNKFQTFLTEHESKNFSSLYLTRTLATPSSQIQTNSQDAALEKILRKIDQDVKRAGRIAKRDLEDALVELCQTKLVSSTQALLIIRCCGSLLPEELPTLRTKLVLDLWNTLDKLGIQLDISHYNAFLRVFLENEYEFGPKDFLKLLQDKGIEPNRVTYCRLMARYCQKGDMDGASSILQIMRDQQLPVNEGVFNTLLMGHTQAGDMDSALSILNLMKQASLDPSEETYTALMCGYAKSGDVNTITELVQECKSKEIFLQDKDFLEIIFTLAASGWSERVNEIIDLLEKSWGYNQDALNLILRLVNINQVDVAFKILKTMPRALLPDGKPAPAGVFYIRQMVKTKQPTAKIVEVCQEMMKSDLNLRALQLALEHSLHLGKEYSSMSEEIMLSLQVIEPGMKQHQFWPLLVAHGKTKNIPGLMKVVDSMKREFNMPPSSMTLRDHVIPYLPKELTSDNIIDILKSAQVSNASAASALLAYRLGQCNIGEAANIAARNNAHYPPAMLRRPLSAAYLHTPDLPSYLVILNKIVDGLTQSNSSNYREVNPDEVIGYFVLDLANAEDASKRAATITAVLKGLVDEGLGMDKESGEQLKHKLGTTLTDDTIDLIEKLTAGDLKPRVRKTVVSRTIDVKEIPNLEKMMSTLEEQSESTLSVRKQLLSLYCRSRDLVKAEAIKTSLDEENFVYTNGMLAQLIELYTYHDLLDKALDTYQQLKQRQPDFLIDHTKVIKLAFLLTKNNQTKDCTELLKEQGKNRETVTEPSFSYNNLCWKLLNTLAEDGNADDLKEMFNVLCENKYITVSNIVLGPLVKVHIVRGDLKAALTEFERCCLEYRMTPCKNDLSCKLIMSEDSTALQKLTDLSTGIHGEANSLYDLVFSFVECGKVKHAKRILETPGLGSRPQRIQSACERYYQEGLLAPLEGLLDATKDVAHIVDRSLIYNNLLMCYVKDNNVEKALELWTRIQEEDIVSSDQFLRHLAALLQKNGHDVPFSVPIEVPAKPFIPASTAGESKKVATPPKPDTPVTHFRKFLKPYAGMDNEGRDSESYTVELKKMASGLISDIGDKQMNPNIRDLKFALKHLSAAGELDIIEAIGKLLTHQTKKMTNFEKHVCIANVVTGKGEQYLAKLEHLINEAKSEDLELLKETYPRGGSTSLLIHSPQLQQRFEDMARTYAVRDIFYPINDLWAYLFEAGQESQAGELWSEFLEKNQRVVLEHVLETARTNGDTDLGQRLVNQLKCSDKIPWLVGSAYGCLADIYTNKKQSDEAVKVLEEALNGNYVEGIKRPTIKRLQRLLQTEGRSLPETIVNLMTKQSASKNNVNSSDDEK